jgi:hemerythrin-like domain-containing protein
MTLVLDPTTLPEAINGWLVAHVAFRRDADALVAAVDTLDPSDYVAAGRLADAFAITVQMLHEHHETEDDLVFPDLIERAPAFAGVVMTMSLEHVDLDDVVDDIKRDVAILSAGTSRAYDVHERLGQRVATFKTLICLHLDAEEEHALPLLVRHFSDVEMDAIRDAHLAKNVDKLNVMIPWAATALPADAATQMIASMPADVRENIPKWSAGFRQRFAPLLGTNAHAVAA